MSSTFHARAELHGVLGDVRRVMGHMPNVKLVSTGTRMRYMIQDQENSEEAGAIIEFTSNDITFRFFFKKPNEYEYRYNLLRFLTILAYLKELYTVDLGDIYSYIIEVLRRYDCIIMQQDSGSREEIAKERMEALNDANVSLSHELSRISEQIREMSRRLDSYKAFSKEVIDRLAQRNGKAPSGAGGVLYAIGIDKGLVDEIASLVCVEASKPEHTSGVHVQ